MSDTDNKEEELIVNVGGKKKERVVKEKGSVTKVATGGSLLKVKVDTSLGDVVDFVKNGGEVVFDAEELPDFSEKEVRELPYRVAQEFFKALDIKKTYEKRKSPLSLSIIGNILGGNSLAKIESLRRRVGWHQTWKRDDELDDALAAGYVQVREKGKESERPGQETGPVIVIKRDGKTELVALEIRQELVDKHNKAVSEKSQSAYKNMKEDFREKVEEINVSVGGTRKDPAIVVVDNEGKDE